MNQTRVVHVREPHDIYIGRAVPRRGFKASKWANPFKIGRLATRSDAIWQYRRYLTQHNPELMAALPELKGKVLGCWCKPEACHGDVLAELADLA